MVSSPAFEFRPAASRAPAEIVDTVIDYLHSDRPALAKCGLVCRSWVPASRYHLLGKIALFPANVESFIDLLASPQGNVTPYVRRLELYNTAQDENWALKYLQQLGVLKWLDTLLLQNTRFTDPDQISLKHTFSELKRLSVYITSYAAFHLADVVCAFPFLQELTLHVVGGPEENTKVTLPGDALKSLQTLTISGMLLSSLLSWLSSQESPRLTSLQIDYPTPEDAPCIQKCLDALGSSLHHFHITAPVSNSTGDGPDADYVFERVHLSHNTDLRSIYVDILYITLVRKASVQWLHTLLSRIASRYMEHITIKLSLRTAQEVDSLPWVALSDLFTSVQYANLRSIRFIMWGFKPASSGWISDKLPDLAKKGLLKFQYID